MEKFIIIFYDDYGTRLSHQSIECKGPAPTPLKTLLKLKDKDPLYDIIAWARRYKDNKWYEWDSALLKWKISYKEDREFISKDNSPFLQSKYSP